MNIQNGLLPLETRISFSTSSPPFFSDDNSRLDDLLDVVLEQQVMSFLEDMVWIWWSSKKKWGRLLESLTQIVELYYGTSQVKNSKKR